MAKTSTRRTHRHPESIRYNALPGKFTISFLKGYAAALKVQKSQLIGEFDILLN